MPRATPLKLHPRQNTPESNPNRQHKHISPRSNPRRARPFAMNRATETGRSLSPSNRASIPVVVQLQPPISPESRLIFMRPDLTAILGRVRRDYWTAPSPGVLSRNLSVSHSPLGIQKPLPPFSSDQGTDPPRQLPPVWSLGWRAAPTGPLHGCVGEGPHLTLDLPDAYLKRRAWLSASRPAHGTAGRRGQAVLEGRMDGAGTSWRERRREKETALAKDPLVQRAPLVARPRDDCH